MDNTGEARGNESTGVVGELMPDNFEPPLRYTGTEIVKFSTTHCTLIPSRFSRIMQISFGSPVICRRSLAVYAVLRSSTPLKTYLRGSYPTPPPRRIAGELGRRCLSPERPKCEFRLSMAITSIMGFRPLIPDLLQVFESFRLRT